MIVTSCLTAAFYVNERRTLAAVTKIISSLGFMLIAFITLSKNFGNLTNLKYGIVMITGLILCFVGDVFLLLKELFEERTANMYLILGVTSFSLAQILFSIMFVKYAPEFKFWLLPIVAIAPAILLVSHKLNIVKFDKFAAALIVYSVIIGFAMVSALNLLITRPSRLSLALFFALLMFMTSDTALCYTYYGRSITLRRILNYVVMLFYFSATILLAYSIMLV